MLTSQYLMLTALAGISVGWILTGGAPGRRNCLAATFIQTAAATLLTFTSDNLPLCIFLVAVIIAAIIWMIRRAGKLSPI